MTVAANLQDPAQSAHHARAVQTDPVMLNSSQQLERGGRRERLACLAQPHPHYAMQHQREETDASVRTNALGQSVKHRSDLDLALEHPKATLDIGQTLITLDDFSWREIIDIGEQHEFAVKGLVSSQYRLVDVPSEAIALQIHLNDRTEVRLGHRMVEARFGARIRELASASAGALVLRIELGRPTLGVVFERLNTIAALCRHLAGRRIIVTDHQAQRRL